MRALKVIIAGGGTGGHIFPAVAIGHALKRLRPDAELLFVGANGKMEMEKVPKEGFEIIGLDIVGFNRGSILKNISLPVKLLKSRMQSRNIIRQFKPSVIVGVGGYASFPIMYAGQHFNIPTLIQEQNSYAGKSNKILSRRANAVCVAYDHMDKFFPSGKLLLTGNPVRNTISVMSKTSVEGKNWFGLKEGITTVLIIGGSLGAKSVNESIDANLGALMKLDVQLLWQTGRPYYQQALKIADLYPDRIKVREFITEMDYAYAASDIIVSRSGALAIAEICIAGKPVIFVPYPFAAEDHQTSNAMALVNNNAAWLLKDNEVKEKLSITLMKLLEDKNIQAAMTKNLKALAVSDADEKIAKKVIEIANSN